MSWSVPDSPIYLDYQASTPLDPRVLEVMLPHLTERFGNASSSHSIGRAAATAVEDARAQLAGLLGAKPQEIIFTSGATEANNLAIGGVAAAHPAPAHIISAPTEHPSVLEPLKMLGRRGWRITLLKVNRLGEIDLDELASAVRPDTVLVTLMAANNELGTTHPVEEIAQLTRSCGVLLHIDAAQAAGKVSLDLGHVPADLLSVSAHKMYGPQGVGALFVRRGAGTKISPILFGGGQERGLRSGTLNTAGIVGLGYASELATMEFRQEQRRAETLRNRLQVLLQAGWPHLMVNGSSSRRLPGSLHVTFPGVDAEALMANCPMVAFSSGSACSSAAPTASHVLRAVGFADEIAEASVRLSVGRFTTQQDVDSASRLILEAARRVYELTCGEAPIEIRVA